MTASSSWVGTQLRVFAVSGLERAHSEPFVRVVYSTQDDSEGSRVDCCVRRAVRALESASRPMERLPERRGGRCYTARWTDTHGEHEECGFHLPARVDWVELQVWNRFASGFDVLLAKAALSIEQLRAQLVADGGHKASVQSTGCMWAPLQVPSRDETPDRRGLMLSAQLSVDFVYDDRVARIRQQFHSRKAARIGAATAPEAGADRGEGGERPCQEVADPTFAFTRPFLPVEWSVVAAASVRQLFFYNDVERVDKFRELVMYGDVARELAEDDEDEYALHVDPGHLTAFRLAQFAAQYLSHCVDSLDTRVEEHSDQLRTLTRAAQSLRHRKRALNHQRKRLEQERDQLALVIETYERLSQTSGGNAPTTGDSSCPRGAREASVARAPFALEVSSHSPSLKPLSAVNSSVAVDASQPSASSPLSAKKPAFIMTWEERERERQREKEATKAQRVQEEQRRLQQRLEERAAHDQRAAEDARRRDHSARVVQRWMRNWLWLQRRDTAGRKLAVFRRAATVIQVRFRQWRLTRAFPLVREDLRQEQEQRSMGTEDERSRRCSQPVEIDIAELETAPPVTEEAGSSTAQQPLDPPDTPSKADVELLVSTWRALRREICREARGQARDGSSDFYAVFQALDTRRDGVVDRAEMRRGARERFKVHLDRKLTRGILSLIRGKAGEPPRPLLLTFDQFVRGLDLSRSDAVRSSESSVASSPEERVGGSDTAAEGSNLALPSRARDDRLIEAQELKTSPFAKEETAEDQESINQRLEAVAIGVQALRKAVNEAARVYLAARGSLSEAPGYREFRDALLHVFASFDLDGNGRLDVRELAECLASLGVRVTDEHLALVRECFCASANDGDASNGDDDSVTIGEFISFVLSDASTSGPDVELGLLGFRVRSAVLDCLERARARLDSKGEPSGVEEALRWVFRSAYPGKRRECPLRDFARALRAIKGLDALPPAKVVRVAARLDRNSDQSVSFDELLVWLRLLPGSSASSRTMPLAEAASLRLPLPDDRRSGFSTVLKDASDRVQRLRAWLSQVASAINRNGASKTRSATAQASALFDRVDSNASGKIARDELEAFFSSLPPEMTQLGCESDAVDVSAIAEQLVDLMDCSGNGVVTRDEWLRFATDLHAPIAEEFSVRVVLRSTIESTSAFSDRSATASKWLGHIPGAIPTAMPTAEAGGVVHFKVRVGEFKSAVRKAIDASAGRSAAGDAMASSSAVPLVVLAVEAASKQLDTDGSGWITTDKLQKWLFPTRDLEELLRLVRSRWRDQRLSKRASPGTARAQVAEKLYLLFDADGNGCLARRELQAGFRSTLGLEFTDLEVRVLVSAFDSDGDQLWSRQEFLAFAQEVVESADGRETPTEDGDGQPTDAGDTKVKSSGSNSDDNGDDDEPLLVSSSSSYSEALVAGSPPSGAAAALPTYSDTSFLAVSRSAESATDSQKKLQIQATEYDDDFDE